MAYPTMGQPTDTHFDTQESMFEDRSSYAQAEEEMYEGSQESSDDAHEDFPEGMSLAAQPKELAVQPEREPELERPGSSSAAHAAAIQSANQSVIQGAGQAANAPATEAAESHPSPLAVLTVDEFAALEERVVSAVALVRRERQARAAAEERAAAFEAQLHTAESTSAIVEELQQEVQSLRAEREQVRQRVERLLSQLDALEL